MEVAVHGCWKPALENTEDGEREREREMTRQYGFQRCSLVCVKKVLKCLQLVVTASLSREPYVHSFHLTLHCSSTKRHSYTLLPIKKVHRQQQKKNQQQKEKPTTKGKTNNKRKKKKEKKKSFSNGKHPQ